MDLAAPLREMGIPVKVEELPFGDAQIIGRGPEERPVLEGVELKTTGDLITSLNDERLTGHQLPGMLDYYERTYLLVEGLWTSNRKGELVVMKLDKRRNRWEWMPANPSNTKQPVKYATFVKRLLTLETRYGVRVGYTGDRLGTAVWLAAHWSWWNETQYEKHSIIGFRDKPLDAPDPLTAMTIKPTTKMKVAAALQRGVGFVKSLSISRHFRSVREMVNAAPAEWEKIDGVGKKLAAEIVAEIEREER